MDFSPRLDRVAPTSYKWAKSAHGFDAAQSGTLDVSALDAETHYPEGHIESGFAVGMITATGLLAPYDPDEDNGQEIWLGVIVDNHTVGVNDMPVSYITHGLIDNDELPFPIDTAGVESAAGRFTVYGEVGS